MNFLFDGEGVEFSDFMRMRSLRVQQQILDKVSGGNSGQSPQTSAWQGFLSPSRQADSILELFGKGLQYALYAVEEGREQEDILLQRTRLIIAGGGPSLLPKTGRYLNDACILGCPSCGSELNFGLYRRCGHCMASLKYVIQCGKCDHLRVGVDCRMFIEKLKCDGCGQDLREIRQPTPTELNSPCSKCGAVEKPMHSSGLCYRCRMGSATG